MNDNRMRIYSNILLVIIIAGVGTWGGKKALQLLKDQKAVDTSASKTDTEDVGTWGG